MAKLKNFTENEQRLFVDNGNFSQVKEMIETGCPVYPAAQRMMPKRFSEKELEKLIVLMKDNGILLTSEMLIYWLRIEHAPAPKPKSNRIFGNCDDRLTVEISPEVRFLIDYACSHHNLRWPREFVSAVVDSPKFAEIYNYVPRIKDLFSHEDLNKLARRDDFIEVFSQLQDHLYLPEDTQNFLLERGLKYLLAYAKNTGKLSPEVVNHGYTTNKLSGIDMAEIVPYCQNKATKEFRELIPDLLKLMSFKINKELVRTNYTGCPWTVEEQRWLLKSSEAGKLFAAFITWNNSVAPELKAAVLSLLDPKDKNYTSLICSLLCSEVSDEFVWLLANKLNDVTFTDINWYHSAVYCNTDLWLKLLDTPKSTVAMKIYSKHRDCNNMCNAAVLAKIPDMPNAPELIAFWDYGKLPEPMVEAIRKSRNLSVIKDFLSDKALSQINEEN